VTFTSKNFFAHKGFLLWVNPQRKNDKELMAETIISKSHAPRLLRITKKTWGTLIGTIDLDRTFWDSQRCGAQKWQVRVILENLAWL
jgi:hypothetical protein